MKSLLIGIACILSVLYVGCHDDPADVGMMLEDGGLLIFGSLCGDDERILSLRVWDDKTDEVLWNITSANGTRDQVFLAGLVPEGFEEEATFDAPLDSSSSIGAEIEIQSDTRTFSIRRVYRFADLRTGAIRAHGDLINPEDWDRHVSDRVCTTEKGLLR